MNGRGARGAGILDPGRAFKAQIGRGLQHQRGGKVLRGEAGVEMAEHDLVDVLGGNCGIGKGIARDSHDKALDGFAGELAKRTMCPSYDAGGHYLSIAESLHCRILVAFPWLFPWLRKLYGTGRWNRLRQYSHSALPSSRLALHSDASTLREADPIRAVPA